MNGLGILEAANLGPESLEDVRVKCASGEVNPLDFLIEFTFSMVDDFGAMPSIAKLREAYDQKLPLACPDPVIYYEPAEEA
jgi:hypothetical protein